MKDDDDVTMSEAPPLEDTQYLRGYVFSTKVIHLYDPNEPRLPGVPVERAPSLCGVTPLWPGRWFDTEGVEGLRECIRCLKVQEAWKRD